MKNRYAKLTRLIWIFIALPVLVNPAAAASTGRENAAPPALPSEMGPIVAGAFHTCALTAAGGVICWGTAYLGNNSSSPSHSPVHVSGLSSGVKAIAAGGGHTCVVTQAGGAKCWGDNDYGQLGNNSTTDSPVPVDVYGLTSGVSAIATGPYHTCALTTTGGAKCWGHNLYGQLGDGSTTDSPIPVDVSGLSSGVSAIAAGGFYTCAVSVGGAAMCWGINTSGELGVEPITMIPTPVTVTGLSSGVSAITANMSTSCALTAAGGVMCWGSNYSGQLGNDSPVLYSYTPVQVSGLSSGVSSISSGYGFHVCAVTTAGGAKCWGDNWNAQLGIDSTITSSRVPVDVHGLASGVTAITGGYIHSCAMLASGGMKCWGSNNDGQLGNYRVYTSRIPVDVLFVSPLNSIPAHDGWVLEKSENANAGGTLNATAPTLVLGDDNLKRQYRSVLSFNTGTLLPDNAVITRVMLKLRKSDAIGGGNPASLFQGFMVDIKKGAFGATAALQPGDFSAIASKTYGPFSPVPSGDWYNIGLTNGKAYINKLGLTQIRLRFKLDDNNNNIANFLRLYSGNATNARDRARLILEYYVP